VVFVSSSLLFFFAPDSRFFPCGSPPFTPTPPPPLLFLVTAPGCLGSPAGRRVAFFSPRGCEPLVKVYALGWGFGFGGAFGGGRWAGDFSHDGFGGGGVFFLFVVWGGGKGQQDGGGVAVR